MKKRMNIVMVALLTILASCSTNYQMVTRVHKDGTVERKYGHSPILLSWPETVTIIRFCFGWERLGSGRIGFMHRDGLLWGNRKTES